LSPHYCSKLSVSRLTPYIGYLRDKLADHPLSPSSQRVHTGALRSLLDGLGADTRLAALDEPGASEQLAAWFRGRYAVSSPATRVR